MRKTTRDDITGGGGGGQYVIRTLVATFRVLYTIV